MLVRIRSKIDGAIKESHWYQYEHPNFDRIKDYDTVQNICKDDFFCHLDSVNWTIMNKTEITSNIYKFIAHRVSIVKDGFANNFWPDEFDWGFILDCILWF
ncbi:hypothetical protein V7127_02690 [Bacillus sp. JJ1773]|uniref:hypothetical protein n=1 Tax=Bacillus sp. JJ1773 TaxID=3122965 RepID=UPI002FFF1DCC